ncbi:TetR/AcrR family transcriptional regulator [Streptomyces sp. GQFP]|uniref:TetR/AcrR family transcriptional regulator n=1 Tax=Streptomyces sp. GQFP TaxID=2907545 RepID=UPI001F2AE64F|nr:helix-turn-helix domain-containing protein [Streptomyces sp. GQFP]UIX30439.1 TetR/AcrR family transcriptional regulator [Streptomyces sp. GQFP]
MSGPESICLDTDDEDTTRRPTLEGFEKRTGITAELAQVVFELFRSEGFGKVTVNDLAAAAGVSRSTFLRYDWTALRHALGVIVEPHRQDPAGALVMSRLIMDTPSLCARSQEKQAGWRPAIAAALAERAGSSGPTALGPLGAGRRRGGRPEHRRQPLDLLRRRPRPRRPPRRGLRGAHAAVGVIWTAAPGWRRAPVREGRVKVKRRPLARRQLF